VNLALSHLRRATRLATGGATGFRSSLGGHDSSWPRRGALLPGRGLLLTGRNRRGRGFDVFVRGQGIDRQRAFPHDGSVLACLIDPGLAEEGPLVGPDLNHQPFAQQYPVGMQAVKAIRVIRKGEARGLEGCQSARRYRAGIVGRFQHHFQRAVGIVSHELADQPSGLVPSGIEIGRPKMQRKGGGAVRGRRQAGRRVCPDAASPQPAKKIPSLAFGLLSYCIGESIGI